VTDWGRLGRVTRDAEPPYAAVDLAAFDANAADLVRRAGGLPLRVASKSVRCRALLSRVLGMPGFRGVMAYSLAEAVWLAEAGVADILVAYPSVDRVAWRRVAEDAAVAAAVTVMVDDVAHLDLVDAVAPGRRTDIRICVDVDASLRVGPAHLGVRRSPLRTAADVRGLVSDADRRRGFRVVGLMFYDAQIAGLPDSSPAVRLVKRRSATDLRERRAAIVDAVRALADLEIVNAGGTGSLHVTGKDPVLTELAAGSGLFGPTLFDKYDDFTPRPAAAFAVPVVRRPASRVVTVFGGGYIASGPADGSRLPTPVWPPGLSLIGAEGAGEVQTPLRGAAAADLAVGDRVWFRHAKAGELCERFEALLLVPGDAEKAGDWQAVPTYRGEGRTFG
jgi:D-serine deaminase-like pyridoxal phosphate-dependent protein